MPNKDGNVNATRARACGLQISVRLYSLGGGVRARAELLSDVLNSGGLHRRARRDGKEARARVAALPFSFSLPPTACTSHRRRYVRIFQPTSDSLCTSPRSILMKSHANDSNPGVVERN